MRTLFASTLVALTFALAACGGGGGGNDSQPIGKVRMSMTDAPADNLTQIHLTITAVALKPANGEMQRFEFDQPRTIDNLLDLQGGDATVVLPTKEVPAGRYNWIRLYVKSGFDNTYVVTNDTNQQYALYVPGQQNAADGKERFVQLVSGFTVPVDDSAAFTIDTDVRRAIVKPSGKDYYLIRPAFRLLDNAEVGTITGTVDDSLTCPDGNGDFPGNNVYLYSGTDATTGDVYVDSDGQPLDDSNPVTTANITQQSDGSFTYTIGFVPPGGYTVAFTCEGANDDPATDDDITFKAQSNVTLEADGDTATADLTPPAT